MTVSEAIRLCDTLSPNCLDESLKLRWLSEAEGVIALRVGRVPPPPYTARDKETHLAVAYPYDMLYRHFLLSQIALAHGELAHYNNSIVCFNTALAAYGSYCRRAQGCGDKGSWLFG